MTLLQTLKYSSLTEQLSKAASKSPEQLLRVQQKRLRKLLKYAVQNSAFYRNKYQGLDLVRCELSELPVISKSEIRDNFEQALTDPVLTLTELEGFVADPSNLGHWLRGRYAVSHTSGSQGQPLIIVQDRHCLEVLFSLMSSRANALGRPNLLEGIRRLLNPARIAVVAAQRGFYPSASAFELMPTVAGRFTRLEWFSSLQPDLYERLNEFQPNALVGYASVLEGLALQKERLNFKELRQIANSSEQLSSRARQRVETAFGVPVYDHYGIGECLLLSEGCPTHGGAHINIDWAILEVVDDNYQPVAPGTSGSRVLVTNLANYVQPFIRYEVPDRVVWATESCTCGSNLPRIASIEGRTADIFHIGPEQSHNFITGVVFHHAVDQVGYIREWQAVQLQRNHLELRLELLPEVQIDQRRIARKTLAALYKLGIPPEVKIDIHFVTSLRPDQKTHKFQRMINLTASHVDQTT